MTHKGFRSALTTLAAGGLLSKTVGILREVVFAASFGTGEIATAFRVSVTASLTPSNLVVSDVVSSGFAPTYARSLKASPARAAAMLRAYVVWITISLTAVAMIVVFWRHPITKMIVPGASDAVQEHAAAFLGILAFAIPLFGLSQVTSYALSASGIHWGNALRPTMQSVGLLVGTSIAVVSGEPLWLAYGFLVSWCAYVMLCMLRLIRLGSLGRLRLEDITSGWTILRSGFRVVAPLLVLGVVVQTSVIAERAIASHGVASLIASIDYARMVADTATLIVVAPLGILGLTHLPQLSQVESHRSVTRMMRVMFLFIVPYSLLLAAAAEPITRLLFERGSFDGDDVSVTADVLVGLSIGLVPQGVVYVLSRVLAGIGRNRPVLIWCGAGLIAQVAVQAALIGVVGSFSIGIGIAVNVAVVAIALAVQVGVVSVLRGQLVLWAPSIVGGLCVMLALDQVVFRLGMLAALVGANAVFAILSLRRNAS